MFGNINFRMEEFNKAVLNETATWWQMELPLGDVFFGTAKAKMLGYPDEIFKKYTDFTNLIHRDDIENTMQAMRDHLDGKKNIYETTYRIKNSNGEYIKFYDCGQIVKREGQDVTVMGFVLKVAENVDALEQMKDFKDLIVAGNPSVIDLVSGIK